MRAREHPEYQDERDYLDRAFQSLVAKRARFRSPVSEMVHEEAQLAVEDVLGRSLSALGSVQDNPYFARLDFHSDSEKYGPRYYLGRVSFEGDEGIRVVNWAADIGRLFYQGRPGRTSYLAPGGRVEGDLLLKRRLEITAGSLLDITDVFDLRPQQGQARPDDGTLGRAGREATDIEESYVARTITGRTGQRLQDITATIQREQYEIISAPADGALVVLGVAGSGKTSIALQRLAYLLYPGNSQGIRSERCIVFGPSRLFLSHIQAVLPDLGVTNIPQIPLHEWSLTEVGRASARTSDVVSERLAASLAPSEEQSLRNAARVRNSYEMSLVLDEYVRRLDSMVELPKVIALPGTFGPERVEVQIETDIDPSTADQPLNLRRESALNTLKRRAVTEFERAYRRKAEELRNLANRLEAKARALEAAGSWLGARTRDADFARAGEILLMDTEVPAEVESPLRSIDGPARDAAVEFRRRADRVRLRAERLAEDLVEGTPQRLAQESLAAAVESALAEHWRHFDAFTLVRTLFADRGLLAATASDILTPEEIISVTNATFSQPNVVDLTDLPAVHYLHVLLNGGGRDLFDHIVIDEAQDVSRLHYAVLAALAPSFTVVGDLNQGLSSFRGVESAIELEAAFYPRSVRLHRIVDSYRATAEITLFANSLLAQLSEPSTSMAKPFNRHGPPPERVPAVLSSRTAVIAEILHGLIAEGVSNVAVLCRTPQSAATLGAALQATLPDVIASSSTAYSGGVVVLPILAAKGMEFEAVVLAEAGEHDFSATDADVRMLYVAVTRALHRLFVIEEGALAAPLIRAFEGQGA